MIRIVIVAAAIAALGVGSTTTLEPDPVLQFQGGITAGASAIGYPAAVTVDCTSGDCILTGALDGGYPITGIPLTYSGGDQTYDVPETGDPCAQTYYAAGTLAISEGVEQLTLTRSGGEAVFDCSGVTNTYGAFTYTVVVNLVSGTFCVLDDSCVDPTPTPTTTPTATAVPVGPDSGAGTAGEADSPGVLSTLPTVAEAARPLNAVWAVALAIVLIILIALPTQLLNSAVESGSDRLSAWLKARKAPRLAAAKPLAGWPIAAAGVLAASFIASFVDPAFGFNPASLRIFASVLVSFILEVVVGWFVVIWLVRRLKPDAAPTFRFVPATLLIVVAAVLFTRFTGFQPGLVFGLVAGVVFGTLVASADRARAALLGLGYAFAAGILGWIGYSLLSSRAEPTAVTVFASETLSALAIGGMAALPIALVPFRGMTGHVVWEWNKRIWALAYGLGLVGFFFVLMPMPFSWAEVGFSIGTWIGLFLLYAVVALLAWLLVVRPWEKGANTEVD